MRIVACIGQRVAAGMAQHVDMNLKGEAGALADALDQAIDGIGGEGRAPLGLENSRSHRDSQQSRRPGETGSFAFVPPYVPRPRWAVETNRERGEVPLMHGPDAKSLSLCGRT